METYYSSTICITIQGMIIFPNAEKGRTFDGCTSSYYDVLEYA